MSQLRRPRALVRSTTTSLLACLIASAGVSELLGTIPLAAQERVAGTVKVMSGLVTAERGGQSRPLKPGDPIYETDVLRTGADGQVGVTLRDETRLSLGPNTEMVLSSFVFSPADQRYGLVIRLGRGLLEFISGQLSKLAPETIRIETPSSVIGVRGTHILVRAGQP